MKHIKKVIIALALMMPMGAMASSTSPLTPYYKSVYCYPTGSYWQKQINASIWSIAYYSNPIVNAYWTARMGAGTRYC